MKDLITKTLITLKDFITLKDLNHFERPCSSCTKRHDTIVREVAKREKDREELVEKNRQAFSKHRSILLKTSIFEKYKKENIDILNVLTRKIIYFCLY